MFEKCSRSHFCGLTVFVFKTISLGVIYLVISLKYSIDYLFAHGPFYADLCVTEVLLLRTCEHYHFKHILNVAVFAAS
jgi:hypothetical protein